VIDPVCPITGLGWEARIGGSGCQGSGQEMTGHRR
jgi:hypothetical protein